MSIEVRARSRQRQLQRLLGDELGRVMPYESAPGTDLPAAGWYAQLSEQALRTMGELGLWKCENMIVYLGGDFAHAAGSITLILRSLNV